MFSTISTLRLRKTAALRAQADQLSALFMTGAEGLMGSHPEELASVMQQLEQTLSSGADARPAILLSAARDALDIEDALDDLDVQRALDRLRHHAGRSMYYLHQLDRVAGAAHFEVGDAEALALHAALAARLPGYLVPKLVREVAGQPGKTPLQPADGSTPPAE